jgi:DHA1 family solute carrier family 18 vesicular amine transporter 1/2
MLSNSAYSIVAPFLPLEFVNKGISSTLTGYIFAAYSMAFVIASPFIGRIISKIGRRGSIMMGLILMGISFIAFGMIGRIESRTCFILAALVTRLCQGFAGCCVQVTCYSVAANFYPDKKGRIIGLLEASQGLGFMFGPLLGSALFTLAGYNFMLYSFGVFFLFVSIVCRCLIPQFIDCVAENKQLAISAIDMNVSGHLSFQRRLRKDNLSSWRVPD